MAAGLTFESIRATEANILSAFKKASRGNIDSIIFYEIDARSNLKRMLNDYAEGRRIVSKLFDVSFFNFIKFKESDITDGSKCEISPRSKAVKKFYGDNFSIMVSPKWVEYIRNYCVFNKTASLANVTFKSEYTIQQKLSINLNIYKEFLPAARIIFKPPLTNVKFPKEIHRLSDWLTL